MNRFFLDTSVLIKLFHKEAETENVIELLANSENNVIRYLSKMEFISTIFKKVRTKEISQNQGLEISNRFESIIDVFKIVEHSIKIETQAIELLKYHSHSGLRTLDAIQLSCAINAKNDYDMFYTFDNKLQQIAILEGLKCS